VSERDRRRAISHICSIYGVSDLAQDSPPELVRSIVLEAIATYERRRRADTRGTAEDREHRITRRTGAASASVRSFPASEKVGHER
jgi:hypothetical protein